MQKETVGHKKIARFSSGGGGGSRRSNLTTQKQKQKVSVPHSMKVLHAMWRWNT